MDETIGRLRAEGEALDALIADLADEQWSLPTPAAGWTIAHQVGHLQWTDEVALLAATDRAAFNDVLVEALSHPDFTDREATSRAALKPEDLLTRWRAGRTALAHALAAVDPADKIPWFGPWMSPRSMATARLMETWAHGQDVADALGVHREPTERLRDVAHLGVRTRDFAFSINEIDPPTEEFRVELTAPDGSVWTWGPEDAAQRVTGSAEDFCLLVTQRRELDQVDLVATGDDGGRWLEIAQAFAGPPKSVVRAAHPKPATSGGQA
jgi:uncharacterized protein (TIGR03084 family)